MVMVPSSASSSCDDCTHCRDLKLRILDQINAFKTLASLNPKLSWTILVQNIEELVTKDTHTQKDTQVPVPESLDTQVVESTCSPKSHTQSESQVTVEKENPVVQKTPVIVEEEKIEADQLLHVQFNVDTNSDHILNSAKLVESDQFIDKVIRDGKSNYECRICYKSSSSRRDTRLHVCRVHQMDRWTCVNCSFQCYDRKDLVSHKCVVKSVRGKKKVIRKRLLVTKKKKKVTKTRHKHSHHNVKFPKSSKEHKEEILTQGNLQEEKTQMDVDQFKFDKDKIVVRNPCPNFSLEKTLSAHIKLERIHLQDDSGEDFIDFHDFGIEENQPISPSSPVLLPSPTESKENSKTECQSSSQSNLLNESPSSISPTIIEEPQQESMKKSKKMKKKSKSKHKRKNFSHFDRKKSKKRKLKIKDSGKECTAQNDDSSMMENQDDALKNVDLTSDPSPYKDMPQMTLHQHSDGHRDDDLYVDIDDDNRSNSSPPLLSPVIILQCHSENGQSGEMEEDVEMNDLSKSQTDLNPEMNKSDDNAPSTITIPLSNDDKRMKRASLDEVDSKIVAKVNWSGTGGGVTYSCIECDKNYKDTTAARRHIRIHHFNERHVCAKCNKQFQDSSRQRKHERMCKIELSSTIA